MGIQYGHYIILATFLVGAVQHGLAQSQSTPPLVSQPLWVENMSPMAQHVALPSQRSAQIADAWSWELNTAIASHWTVQDEDDTTLRFDGETTRMTAALEWGFASRYSARVVVPWIQHTGGFLDPLINDWHALFGMSDGGRQQFTDDQLAFQYRSDRHTQSLTGTSAGIGDIRTELSYQLAQSPTDSWSLSAGYKWATGDEDQWLGSGGGDAFATLRYSGRHRADLPLIWHGQLGYIRAGKSALLGPEQRRHLWQAGVAVEWQLTKAWSLLAQLDGHAGVMRSQVPAVDEPTVMLALGMRYALSSELTLDASFIEDIRVESAPDVTFQASLRWTSRVH